MERYSHNMCDRVVLSSEKLDYLMALVEAVHGEVVSGRQQFLWEANGIRISINGNAGKFDPSWFMRVNLIDGRDAVKIAGEDVDLDTIGVILHVLLKHFMPEEEDGDLVVGLTYSTDSKVKSEYGAYGGGLLYASNTGWRVFEVEDFKDVALGRFLNETRR